MASVYRRKFEGRVYDFFDEYRTEGEAVKQKKELIRTGWSTHAVITKSTRPEDKNPFRLWVHSDPATVWKIEKKEGVIKEIDKEIRPLVKDLNAHGVYTVESCSGHGKEPGKLWLLRRTFSLRKFMAIMKKHGVKDIKRRSQYSDSNRDLIYFTFDLPGEITYKRDKKRVVRPRKKQARKSVRNPLSLFRIRM